MNKYQKPPELYDGLRLHQNENTGGCSPRVIEALASLRVDQISLYPPYEHATQAAAQYLGVDAQDLSLVNGLDEGIMALAVAYLRPAGRGIVPEAIIPEPAFEIFGIDTEVVGGRPVRIPPKADFSFALDGVLSAITPNTRVVFLTNPNNPTGAPLPLEGIREVARRVPQEAVVFVDEAYAEFSGVTFIRELKNFPNVLVGRTFSKAFGLAGLRVGAVTGSSSALEPLRLALPVYSVNIAAVTALPAALSDLEHLNSYLKEVNESKALLYAACERLGLKYWPSAANFVLVHAGDQAAAVVKGVATRGVYIRDRSNEPGCAGCMRIATGVVAHTARAIAAIEEVLCGAL